MRLSFCMIVKNEAAHLADCLASVSALADELIVLDTGSTDETVAIAQRFGARVESFAWTHSFAEARNAALHYVTGDWVLVLDADERLVPQIQPQIQQAIQNQRALVINLVRQEIGAAQSPYSLVSRLFRRHPAIRWSRPYHAMIDDSVTALLQQEPNWQVLNLSETAILHYGYSTAAITGRDKLTQAKTAMEGFLTAHPNDAYLCSKLGALYIQTHEFERSIELLENGLKYSPDPATEYELHYHLGIAYSRLEDIKQSEAQYRAAIQQPILESLKLGAINNLGSLLKEQGDLAQAARLYQTCLVIDPTFAVGYFNLGMTLKATGQLDLAVAHYQQAIQHNPGYAEAYQSLAVTLLKLGQVGESLAAFRQAIELHSQHNPAEAERLRQGLAEMGLRL
ncbi:MAG: tetratricopeptide repeat protein [Pegethrix bostrychoides GSE-TBD4-15B]|jgi:tetratricopeptide (TPR) repeat protein|uniref:Tetratricopeptide repeat protein n=1 Tax=Pegethrix bostrychoides GSE-TBD4-15B TaxID=2839662 RepID=A0A951PF06_9CYAN|nr:tetratricopeptide repeat protein [Pegethrix bostrychoides GSE-TBD4-15B]